MRIRLQNKSKSNNYMESCVINEADGQIRYDVGVDANNFFPVSTRQIVSFFEA